MLLITGCDKGKLKPNVSPTIAITSYEGSGVFSDSLPQQSFQAKIYWNATDVDGTIKGFAFRVLDLQGNPIPTPLYSVIDTSGEFTPAEVQALTPNKFGWVLHYKPGADQSIPLTSPTAKKTIWSTQKYATVNFPAADGNGNPMSLVSKFEIIAIDNRGAISNIAVRYFNATSAKPLITLSTTKGNPNGGVVGTGLKLSFGINDFDPFLTSVATHYEFAIYKHNMTTGVYTPSGTDTTWISTLGLPKINEYKLTKQTTPALVPDFDGETQVTETVIYARAFDLAGIKSDVKTIKFAVKEGFRPQTLIYGQRVLALGDNHFIDYLDDSTPEVLPYVYTSAGAHYATPFFRDTTGKYTAIYSPNLKVTLRWGWHGEYGTTSSAGVVTTTDNPFDRKQDNVLDSLDANYYSEVVGFDLRLDNQPYNFPPLINSIVTDPDGKRWLRVRVTDPIAQSLVMTNLGSGRHIFEARAIDLQDEIDRTPAVFEFYLVNPVTAANRHDVLILDDDVNNNPFSPDATVDALYENFVSTAATQHGITNARIVQIDRESINDLNADVRKRRFAASELQNYKLVIYHSDGGYLTSHLDSENDGLSLYLLSGGNVVISGGQNLQPINQAFVQKGQNLLSRYFGVAYNLESIIAVQTANSFIQRPWFIQATSLVNPPYSNLGVELTTPFNSLVLSRHGLGPVSYIAQKTIGAQYLYSYGSKAVGTSGPPDYAPSTQELFDQYNGKPVALKTATGNNKCYFFTFPLSYMNVANTQGLFNQIFNEVSAGQW